MVEYHPSFIDHFIPTYHLQNFAATQCDQYFGPEKARDQGQKAPTQAREKKFSAKNYLKKREMLKILKNVGFLHFY